MDKEFRLKDGLHVSGNAAIIGSITTVDSVQFNLTHNVTNGIGMLDWSVDDATAELGLTPNVTLQIGQEQLYLVKNQTGNTITTGTVVMAAGTIGNSGRILVQPAIANGTFPSTYIMGVATETIINGGDGFVTAFGKVRGLDTSMWSEGDILYANPGTPGALSNTAPISPNNKVTVAIVVTKATNNGTIFVRPIYGSSIEEDENVYIENIQNEQVLVWSSANARFENKTYTGYQANDYTTYTAALANDYNTLLSAYSNDYNTLLSAYSNDGSTLLTARSNDFSTYSTLAANDGATLLTARANDFSTWNGLNAYINLKANTAGPTFTGDVTIADKIVHDGDTNTAIRFPAADTFTVETSGLERIRVDSAGNFGIGTTPTVKLHLYDGNTAISLNEVASGGSGVASWRLKHGLNHYGAYVAGANALVFYDYGATAERMRLDNLGNLGIGVISPAQRLDVSGNVKISGGIVANNSLGSASQVLTSNGSGIYWSTPTTGSTAYSATIGNGSANTFIITHNLGTQNIFTSIRDTATNYFVYPDIKYNNTNSITIEFSSVPTANSYYVAILGA